LAIGSAEKKLTLHPAILADGQFDDIFNHAHFMFYNL